MTKYQVSHMLIFHGPLDDFDDRNDRLLEALDDLNGIQDADLILDTAKRTVDVTFTIEADDDIDAALTKSLCDLRAAIHAIGDNTQGWEKLIEETRRGARTLDLVWLAR